MASTHTTKTQTGESTPKFRFIPPGIHYSKTRWATPFIAETISGTALIFMPLLVGNIINLFTQNQDSAAWTLVWLIITLVLILAINEKLGWGTLFRTQMMLERDWRYYVSEQLPGIGTQGDPGATIAIMNKDTKAISNMLLSLNQSCSATAIAIFGTIQLWALNPTIAIATLTGVTLTIILLTQISKLLEKRAETFRDTISTNTSKASDIATSIRTIVGLGATNTMMHRYTQSAHDVRTAQLNYERIHSWSAAARTLLIGATTMLATALALQGQTINNTWITNIPASQLITVTGIVSMMVGPIWTVENFLRQYRDARVAYRRISRLAQDATYNSTPTQTRKEQDGAQPTDTHNQQLPPTALTDLTQELQTNRTVHFINPKKYGLTAQNYAENLTTHLRTNPTILKATADNILLAEPNPMIFAGTLHNHMTLGTPPLTNQELENYLKYTDSTEIAHRLGGTNPTNYWQATISAEGTNLSGGQRQRLALARAYAQHKPILILTEPLNSVDEPSQQYIYNKLQTHAGSSEPLAHLTHVFIISTTLETDRRIANQKNTQKGE